MSGQGRFTWYELMTTDPAAGRDFYSKLSGWGVETFDEPMPYTMFTLGESPVAGLMQLTQEAQDNGAPPHWLGYVLVDDADATVAAAQAAGGSVFVEPQDIPEMGRFSVLADPNGGVFAIWQALKDATSDDMVPVGRFSWHELMTTDLELAFDFYSGLFGWVKVAAHDMGDMGTYQIFSRRDGTVPIGGMMTKPNPEMPDAWLYYVRVADAAATIAQVEEMGGQLLHGPMEVPGGDHVAACLDPQGAAFAIHATAG